MECPAVVGPVTDLSALAEKTVHVSFCIALPLLRLALQRRRSTELEYHSIKNIVRSMRPNSLRVFAASLEFEDAGTFSTTFHVTILRVVIDVAGRSRSLHCPKMAAASVP
jgi:hypothetical protein